MMLVNGEAQDHLPVTDRGFQYGDGLFETIEVQSGRAIFLDQHLGRLLKGCIRLQIPEPSIDLIRSEAQSLLAFDSIPPGNCVLKIIITRGSGGRGYRQPDSLKPSRIVSLHPAPDYPSSYQIQGINARFCQTRLGLNPLLAGIKHLNRLEQVMARAEWDSTDIQEGIMRDINGHIIEGTMSNVFFVKGGRLHTPILSHSGIAGIIRSAIIKLAHQHHLSIFEHLFDSAVLLSADEVFVSNSIIGIWPVKQLETTTFRIGPVTQQLQQWLDQLKLE
jgi:4-amino-4-deoxychorismate lyase